MLICGVCGGQEKAKMATFTQYAVVAAEEALSDAGWRPESEEERSMAVCFLWYWGVGGGVGVNWGWGLMCGVDIGRMYWFGHWLVGRCV